jgi:hypothetical protein
MHLLENAENKYYVYALIDPINRIPFYIGKGQGYRAYCHLRPGYKSHNEKNVMYIRIIRQLGLEPGVEFIIENIDEKGAYDIELCCIKLAIKSGILLTNKAGVVPNCLKRGELIAVNPEEIKPKASFHHTKQTRQRISESHRGKQQSSEHLRKLSESRLGGRRSLETKERMSIAQRARRSKSRNI